MMTITALVLGANMEIHLDGLASLRNHTRLSSLSPPLHTNSVLGAFQWPIPATIPPEGNISHTTQMSVNRAGILSTGPQAQHVTTGRKDANGILGNTTLRGNHIHCSLLLHDSMPLPHGHGEATQNLPLLLPQRAGFACILFFAGRDKRVGVWLYDARRRQFSLSADTACVGRRETTLPTAFE